MTACIEKTAQLRHPQVIMLRMALASQNLSFKPDLISVKTKAYDCNTLR